MVGAQLSGNCFPYFFITSIVFIQAEPVGKLNDLLLHLIHPLQQIKNGFYSFQVNIHFVIQTHQLF